MSFYKTPEAFEVRNIVLILIEENIREECLARLDNDSGGPFLRILLNEEKCSQVYQAQWKDAPVRTNLQTIYQQ
jgi:hypothetical protein